MNSFRRFATTAVAFTFIVVGITGLIFQFFFKNHNLEKIHGWLGVAMVAAATIHIVQNWKSLQKHFRDWRVYGLLVPVILVICYFGLGQQKEPPRFGPNGGPRQREGFHSGMDPREAFQKLAEVQADKLADVFGKDVNAVFASLNKDGIRGGNPHESIRELAQQNQKSPDEVLMYFLR